MKKLFFVLTIIIVIISLGSIFIGNTDNRIILKVKNSVPQNFKDFLGNNIFFVFKLNNEISNLKKINKRLEEKINLLEYNSYQLQKIQNIKNHDITKNQSILPVTSELEVFDEDKKSYKLTKYYLPSIPWQLNDRKPGGYLYEFDNKIFVLSGEGEINFIELDKIREDNIILNRISSNIREIVDDPIIYSKSRFGFRGIMINDKKIYLSYQKKIENNCYNIAIISGNLDFEYVEFKDFFSFKECSPKMSNHTGGKMVPYDDESFLFTIGDGQMFKDVQNDKSLWGKLIQINYVSKNFTLIAKGMRDTQGAYYHKKSDVLLMTEHGPQGGDEINVLRKSDFYDYKNFGWPVASYGKVKYNIIEELKYSNHEENGFQEPVYWYKKNSVAPSAIVNVDGFFKNSERDFFMSAMGNTPAPGRRSIHHLRFDQNFNEVEYINIIPIGERIRDLIYIKDINQVVMILENTPSIAFIENL